MEVSSRCWKSPEERLSALLTASLDELPAELIKQDLKEIWPDPCGPLHRHSRPSLLRLFMRAGFVSDGPRAPTSTFRVYRGQLKANVIGIS